MRAFLLMALVLLPRLAVAQLNPCGWASFADGGDGVCCGAYKCVAGCLADGGGSCGGGGGGGGPTVWYPDAGFLGPVADVSSPDGGSFWSEAGGVVTLINGSEQDTGNAIQFTYGGPGAGTRTEVFIGQPGNPDPLVVDEETASGDGGCIIQANVGNHSLTQEFCAGDNGITTFREWCGDPACYANIQESASTIVSTVSAAGSSVTQTASLFELYGLNFVVVGTEQINETSDLIGAVTMGDRLTVAGGIYVNPTAPGPISTGIVQISAPPDAGDILDLQYDDGGLFARVTPTTLDIGLVGPVVGQGALQVIGPPDGGPIAAFEYQDGGVGALVTNVIQSSGAGGKRVAIETPEFIAIQTPGANFFEPDAGNLSLAIVPQGFGQPTDTGTPFLIGSGRLAGTVSSVGDAAVLAFPSVSSVAGGGNDGGAMWNSSDTVVCLLGTPVEQCVSDYNLGDGEWVLADAKTFTDGGAHSAVALDQIQCPYGTATLYLDGGGGLTCIAASSINSLSGFFPSGVTSSSEASPVLVATFDAPMASALPSALGYVVDAPGISCVASGTPGFMIQYLDFTHSISCITSAIACTSSIGSSSITNLTCSGGAFITAGDSLQLNIITRTDTSSCGCTTWPSLQANTQPR